VIPPPIYSVTANDSLKSMETVEQINRSAKFASIYNQAMQAQNLNSRHLFQQQMIQQQRRKLVQLKSSLSKPLQLLFTKVNVPHQRNHPLPLAMP